MNKNVFLTPGPSELFYTVGDHVRTALSEKIGSISHRSKAFEKMAAHTKAQLRELMQIPAGHRILFTASATEIWERIIQNLTEKHTFHGVNGSFSQKFYECAQAYGRQAQLWQLPMGQGFDFAKAEVSPETELIAAVLNETSTGVSMPVSQIATIADRFPKPLLAVDGVSILPCVPLEIDRIDSLYFSVQKCFGLPAGLGVWVVSEKAVEKYNQLKAKALPTGSYHDLGELLKYEAKDQTPETPNVLAIYLLGKVAEDMNRRGIGAIRAEINYKAALIYRQLAEHPAFTLSVDEPAHRSPTVAVAEVRGGAAPFIDYCAKHGIKIGSGYGSQKDTHIRIANFPTHSKEIFEQLADLTAKYEA